jgi:hypothetical protein
MPGIAPRFEDKPFVQQRWRDGPRDMIEAYTGLLLPGDNALIRFREDFMGERGSLLSAASQTGWHEDAVGSPTALALVADGVGGVGVMTPGGTAEDNVHYHWSLNTTVHENFTMAVGKQLWLAARFKIEDADKNLLIMGLHEAADDPWGTEPNDQFLFRTVSGTADKLRFAGGTTNSTEETFTFKNRAGTDQVMSDDTWYRAIAYYDGIGSVRGWFLDDSGHVLGEGSCAFGSTIVPGTPMAVAFGSEAVDTGTDAFSIDYIEVCMER